MSQISAQKERQQLALERQQLRDSLAEGQREAREQVMKEAKIEKENAARHAKDLVKKRADLEVLKDKERELEERASRLLDEVGRPEPLAPSRMAC